MDQSSIFAHFIKEEIKEKLVTVDDFDDTFPILPVI